MFRWKIWWLHQDCLDCPTVWWATWLPSRLLISSRSSLCEWSKAKKSLMLTGRTDKCCQAASVTFPVQHKRPRREEHRAGSRPGHSRRWLEMVWLNAGALRNRHNTHCVREEDALQGLFVSCLPDNNGWLKHRFRWPQGSFTVFSVCKYTLDKYSPALRCYHFILITMENLEKFLLWRVVRSDTILVTVIML